MSLTFILFFAACVISLLAFVFSKDEKLTRLSFVVFAILFVVVIYIFLKG